MELGERRRIPPVRIRALLRARNVDDGSNLFFSLARQFQPL